jgi:Trk K+ transport system NAD-binding subunit
MFFSQPKLVQIWIQPHNRNCGHNISEIYLPKQCQIMGLIRQEKIILANEDPVICNNDFVIAVAINPMFLPELKVCLEQAKRFS